MNKDKTGGSAFPQTISFSGDGSGFVSSDELGCGGMTLRDYFAASVDVPRDMSIGWAVSLAGRAKPTNNDLHIEWIQFWADAGAAYRGICADAMLAERAK